MKKFKRTFKEATIVNKNGNIEIVKNYTEVGFENNGIRFIRNFDYNWDAKWMNREEVDYYNVKKDFFENGNLPNGFSVGLNQIHVADQYCYDTEYVDDNKNDPNLNYF